ncbi:MAG: hypothetical protein AB3N33_08105 [Puniceicoccaceae bacterium]
MTKALHRKQGLALFELLVVMATASLIAVTGMKLIHFTLSQLTDRQTRHLEQLAIDDLGLRLQWAMDQRLEPFTLEDPWLVIRLGKTNSGKALQSLRIRSLGHSGRIQWMELVRLDGHWLLRNWPEDALEEPPVDHPVSYSGDIVINVPEGRFLRNEEPGVLRFNFPEAATWMQRQGFAIHAYW